MKFADGIARRAFPQIGQMTKSSVAFARKAYFVFPGVAEQIAAL